MTLAFAGRTRLAQERDGESREEAGLGGWEQVCGKLGEAMQSAAEKYEEILEALRSLPQGDPGYAALTDSVRAIRDRIAVSAEDRAEAWQEGARTALEAVRDRVPAPGERHLRAI